jgi:hypothetical protein
MLPFDIFGIVGVVSNEDGWIQYSSFAWYPMHAWAGPIVHWVHGNIGKGFAALGTNALIPILTAGFGLIGTDSSSRRDALQIASSVGILAAQAFDAAFFAWEPAIETQTAPKGAHALLPSSVMALPQIDANHVGVVVVGQF